MVDCGSWKRYWIWPWKKRWGHIRTAIYHRDWRSFITDVQRVLKKKQHFSYSFPSVLKWHRHTRESLLFCCNFPSFSGEKPIEFVENVVPFFFLSLSFYFLMIVFSCFVRLSHLERHGLTLNTARETLTRSKCFLLLFFFIVWIKERKKEKIQSKKREIFIILCQLERFHWQYEMWPFPLKTHTTFSAAAAIKNKRTVEMMMTAIQIWNRRNPPKFLFLNKNGSHFINETNKVTSRSRPNFKKVVVIGYFKCWTLFPLLNSPAQRI